MQYIIIYNARAVSADCLDVINIHFQMTSNRTIGLWQIMLPQEGTTVDRLKRVS